MPYRLRAGDGQTFPATNLISALSGAIGWATSTNQTIDVIRIGPVGSNVIAQVEPGDTLGAILGRSSAEGS